jgi:hypothetical protein
VGDADSWLLSIEQFKALCDLLAIELVNAPPTVPHSFTGACAGALQEPAPERGRRAKRSALISDNVRRWPTIERDLKDAAAKGLSDAAKDAAKFGWWWEGSAVAWARASAKVQDAALGLAGMARTIHRLKG